MTATPHARRFLSTVLTRALTDASRGDVDAVCWLASRAATPYFDALDFPQSTVLMRSGWREWAAKALPSATAPQSALLAQTEDYLASLAPRSTP
jgi:hypothetical protein